MPFLLLLILSRLALSSVLAGPSSPGPVLPAVVVMPVEIENTSTITGVTAYRSHTCDNTVTSFFLLRK